MFNPITKLLTITMSLRKSSSYHLSFTQFSIYINFTKKHCQGAQSQCSVTTWRDGVGKEVGGRFRREGTHVCLWLIHSDVKQKPPQYSNYPPIKINNITMKEIIWLHWVSVASCGISCCGLQAL